MGARRTAYLLAAAFAAFAAWEAVQHVWLMELPVPTYHLVSLAIEFGLVVVIALAAMGLVRRQARAELRERAVRDTVVHTLADDLRPPLVSLAAELHSLERAPAEPMSEGTRELARQTAARASALLGMIEDLVALTERSGREAPALGVSPRQLAETVVDSFRLRAEEKGIRLELETGESLPETCAAPDQVLHALSTLVGNAVDRTPRGGEVHMRTTVEGDRLLFSATDTGEPVMPQPAELIAAGEGPAGVGMRHCQSLAEALGGSARYEPTSGGNRFMISVPVRGHRH